MKKKVMVGSFVFIVLLGVALGFWVFQCKKSFTVYDMTKKQLRASLVICVSESKIKPRFPRAIRLTERQVLMTQWPTNKIVIIYSEKEGSQEYLNRLRGSMLKRGAHTPEVVSFVELVRASFTSYKDYVAKKEYQNKGWGDRVEDWISTITVGQGKEMAMQVARAQGKTDCGCDRRKRKLNKLGNRVGEHK